MRLVTPFIQPVHEREIDFLTTIELTASGGTCLGVNTSTAMALIKPEAIAAQVPATASGVSADAVHQLHRDQLGRIDHGLGCVAGMPVITSNQVLVWHALRTLGMMQTVGGYGRLFSRPGA